MINLVQTCGACPEQYDAYKNGILVGYLRLRHGYFTVQVPDPSGETVYTASPRGDGIFESQERDYYLKFAVVAIERHLNHKEVPPNVEYKIVNKPDVFM